MKIRNISLLLLIPTLILAACNQLPQVIEIASTVAAGSEVPTIVEDKAEATQPSAEPTLSNLPPVDVSFEIDCSAIDPDKQPECDDFINQTTNLVYPRLVQFTGETLANCYKVVTYTIIPNDSTQTAGGYTTANAITYMEAYSTDSNIPYDVHELVHSFAWCTGALDFHMFHGALMNAVYFDLDDPEFSQYPSEEITQEEFTRLRETIAGLPEEERFDYCTGLVSDLITIAHFRLGNEMLTRMYQSTINSAPLNQPSELANTIWRATALQAQSLVETIEQGLGHTDMPECGF